ncbi:hypothetical protein L1987_25692 [Smallanthus sonchifolius]|uniref:Uncharacterized protein n=1 Tax=Smallanthus sonchifolius TaxID=185202 RepID=A0ACB9I9M0_9ASTR|nr:hypothetical protein L1987_25692 [Smallanthus sonchifolius]
MLSCRIKFALNLAGVLHVSQIRLAHVDYSILSNQLIISIHRCTIVKSRGVHDVVTEKDLEYLLHLLNGKDAVWQSMIERSTSNMACQAWRYEPEHTHTVWEGEWREYHWEYTRLIDSYGVLISGSGAFFRVEFHFA